MATNHRSAYAYRFLRDDDERAASWDEQLAGKYYDSLYREFAVCDLKHYKSGNVRASDSDAPMLKLTPDFRFPVLQFALRWRTEDEVLGGHGETTCGNTRCRHHHPPRLRSHHHSRADEPEPVLTTLELPFAYEERGESRAALVKVVLCPRCVDKLMWKRRKEREGERGVEEEGRGEGEGEGARARGEDVESGERRGRGKSREKDGGGGEDGVKEEAVEVDLERLGKPHRKRERSAGHDKKRHRRRSSRSRSPREKKQLRFS